MNRSLFLSGLAICVFLLSLVNSAHGQQDPVHIVTSSLNVRENTLKWVEVLGQVKNESSSPVGFVRISATTLDATGKVLDTGSSYANGKTVTVRTSTTDTGIFPGESASFSLTLSDVKLTDIKNIQYAVTYDIAEPRTDFPDAPILTRVSLIESTIDSLRNASNGQQTNPQTSTQIQANRTSIDSLATQINSIKTSLKDLPMIQENRTLLDAIKTKVDSLLKQSGGNTTNSLIGDLDSDGDVDFQDFILFAQAFGSKA